MSAPYTEVYRPEVSGPNPPEFEALDRDVQQSLSHVNFTVFSWDAPSNLLKRIYSSQPEKYPVGGSKKMFPDAPWPSAVIFNKSVHFCRDRDDIKATFSDYENIFSTGAHTQLSWPIIDGGEVVGAVNVSGVEGTYADDTEREEAVERFSKQSLEAYKKWANK